MYDGIVFERCGAIPGAFFGLRRAGHVIDSGHMRDLGEKYQPGDVVLVSYEMWEAMTDRAALQTTGDEHE